MPDELAPVAAAAAIRGVPFLKGHGTENDFVLIPDRSGDFQLSAELVRALCDRRAGIGGDGLLRIAPDVGGTGYLMDYRNADGSLAEMCGNGARVFVKFLYDHGWEPAGPIEFNTRGGRRRADALSDGRFRVQMGAAQVGDPTPTGVRVIDGRTVDLPGRAVDVGNPHLVAFLEDAPDTVALGELDLSVGPGYVAEVFPAGVNVEFVEVTGPNKVTMRVHERGVGETRSCGTGAVAVAAAYLARIGANAGVVDVTVPGGVVQIEVSDDDSSLTGPAVIVGSGWIDADWWAAHS